MMLSTLFIVLHSVDPWDALTVVVQGSERLAASGFQYQRPAPPLLQMERYCTLLPSGITYNIPLRAHSLFPAVKALGKRQMGQRESRPIPPAFISMDHMGSVRHDHHKSGPQNTPRVFTGSSWGFSPGLREKPSEKQSLFSLSSHKPKVLPLQRCSQMAVLNILDLKGKALGKSCIERATDPWNMSKSSSSTLSQLRKGLPYPALFTLR